MKSIPFLLIGIGLLAVSEQAFSQDDGQRKPLNNPMYSTSNYKHPGMATAARRWESKTGVAVKTTTPADAQLANYKHQVPVAQPIGGITVGHTPSTNLADRNYKIQRISEPQPTYGANEYYVSKRRKNDSTTIGQ
ncbi:hypothetical protein GO755_29870 [Spirosoma sp. HMF4905]|uniref:Uncharacterized protein n=1 Tax=Spirosoma arboris TaxID=2682092 RepID=A0A7K1SL30_9BACT|nr:hypothetical protein [Spirosoma arboris]MVM34276.1 hypothetical protein [Spirosoma arboris]